MDRELERICKHEEIMRAVEKDKRKQRTYMQKQSVMDAQTTFEIRTDMLKRDSNFVWKGGSRCVSLLCGCCGMIKIHKTRFGKQRNRRLIKTN